MSEYIRDRFTFFSSYFDAISLLPDSEQLRCYQAICSYALTGEMPDIDGVAGAVFLMAKPTVDKCNMRASLGSKGGIARSKAEANVKQNASKTEANSKQTSSKPQTNAKQTSSDIDIEIDIEKEIDIDNTISGDRGVGEEPKKRFKPPTLDEVRAYCQERHNSVDPEQFINFYTSKGWMVGKNPMKDWKAAVRTWERQSHNIGRRTSSSMNNSDYLDEILLREINGGEYGQTGNG